MHASHSASPVKDTRKSQRIIENDEKDARHVLGSVSTQFIFSGVPIVADPIGSVMKVLEIKKCVKEGTPPPEEKCMSRVKHDRHFKITAMKAPAGWRNMPGSCGGKPAPPLNEEDFGVSQTVATSADLPMAPETASVCPSIVAFVKKKEHKVKRCLKELAPGPIRNSDDMVKHISVTTPDRDRAVKQSPIVRFKPSDPPVSKVSTQAKKRQRRKSKMEGSTNPEKKDGRGRKTKRRRNYQLLARAKNGARRNKEAYCPETHEKSRLKNIANRGVRILGRVHPKPELVPELKGNFYFASVLHDSMEFAPDCQFPLLDKTKGISFVDPGLHRRYFSSKGEAKLYACMAYIAKHKSAFRQEKGICEMWSQDGESELLDEMSSKQLSAKKALDKNLQMLMRNSGPGWSEKKLKTVPKKRKADPDTLYVDLLDSKDIKNIKMFSLGDTRKGVAAETNCIQVEYIQRGFVTYYVNPRLNHSRSSGLHLSRPVPCAREELEGRKKAFYSFIGHGKATGKSGAFLVVHWCDGRISKVLISVLVKDVPFECNSHVIEHSLHRVAGFMLVAKLRYGRDENHLDEAVGSSVPLPAIDGCEHIRETRQVRYAMTAADCLWIHYPMDRKASTDDIPGTESVISRPPPVDVINNENGKATKEDIDLKFNKHNSTYRALGAHGCVKCRYIGCKQCYIEFLCANTKAFAVPGGFRNGMGEDLITNDSCITSMMSMLSVLVSNIGTVGFARMYGDSKAMTNALDLLEQKDTQGYKVAVLASAPHQLLPEVDVIIPEGGDFLSWMLQQSEPVDGRCTISSVHDHTVGCMTLMRHQVNRVGKCICAWQPEASRDDPNLSFPGLSQADISGCNILKCTRVVCCPECGKADVHIQETVKKVFGDLFAVTLSKEPDIGSPDLPGINQGCQLVDLQRQLIIAGCCFTLKGVILGKADNHWSVTVLKDCLLVHDGNFNGGGYHLHGTGLESEDNHSVQAGGELRYVLYERTVA